jgi:transposase
MSHNQFKAEVTRPYNVFGKCLTPFQRQLLLHRLQSDLPKYCTQRIKIMLLADEGKSQSEICHSLGCSAATARHWIHIANSGMAHQFSDSPVGRPKAVNQAYLKRLQELVANSPRDYGYCFRRWTVNWLRKHLAKEFGIEISERNIRRILKDMGLSTIQKQGQNFQVNNQIQDNGRLLIGELSELEGKDKKDLLVASFANIGAF